MASFGSSVISKERCATCRSKFMLNAMIDKSGKKLAPKAPSRARPRAAALKPPVQASKNDAPPEESVDSAGPGTGQSLQGANTGQDGPPPTNGVETADANQDRVTRASDTFSHATHLNEPPTKRRRLSKAEASVDGRGRDELRNGQESEASAQARPGRVEGQEPDHQAQGIGNAAVNRPSPPARPRDNSPGVISPQGHRCTTSGLEEFPADHGSRIHALRSSDPRSDNRRKSTRTANRQASTEDIQVTAVSDVIPAVSAPSDELSRRELQDGEVVSEEWDRSAAPREGAAAAVDSNEVRTSRRQPMVVDSSSNVAEPIVHPSDATARLRKAILARKPRKKSAAIAIAEPEAVAVEGREDDQASEFGTPDGSLPARRRTYQRQPTPEDAQTHEIDPASVTLFELTKDSRKGKKSQLEKAMQEVNWKEVARKRAEQDERIAAGEVQNPKADGARRLDAAAQTAAGSAQHGPRLKLVNGVMVVDNASLVINGGNAGADVAVSGLEQLEESDITRRINSHSWLYDGKREPTERSRAANRSDPWTQEDTEQFWDALRMFGTDFDIISKMFPGRTRRHIKLKFTREERAHPTRMEAALIGEAIPMDMEIYCAATGMEEGFYKDPKVLEEELKQADEQHRVELEKHKEAQAEMQKQRQEAERAKAKDAGKKGRSKKVAVLDTSEEVLVEGDVSDIFVQ